jgi:methyltransferase (TIGR00027 family)
MDFYLKEDDMEDKIQELDFSGVQETGLLTLYNKALESQSDDPILKDEMAESLIARIDPILQRQEGKMAKQLHERTTDPRLNVHIALRSKKFDDYALEYLTSHPDGIIVNIGCGLDTRFFRIDNGSVYFYDLDLPEVIQFKRQLLPETDRYRMIPQSALDLSWMDQIIVKGQPVLFLAEGVLMYLPKPDVKHLILALQRRFPESELVCELTNNNWVEGPWARLAQMKMQRQHNIGKDAVFRFGVSSPDELESWGPGIEFHEMWFYMDENHPKLGWIRIFRHFKMIRMGQYTVKYTLHII